jgi:beta-glucosidase/6-phospho-beta-glucosidase/beta-galactosidase
MPPGKVFDVNGAIAAVWNMVDAHAAAYDAIKANDTIDADHDGMPAMVSIAHHMRAFFPVNPADPAAVAATLGSKYLFNQLFLNAVVYGLEDRDFDGRFDGPNDRAFDPTIAGRLDYIGLNYYGPSIVVPLPTLDFYPLTGIALQSDLDLLGFTAPKTEVGWAIYPQGLRDVIDQLTIYGLPIVITENGIADSTDAQRPRFIMDHLSVVAQAISDGIDIRGYFHWTLTDNFEWASGYCPRFGLYHVDYASPDKTRTLGAGARVYRSIIAANTVPQYLFDLYPTYPAPAINCPRRP